MSNSNNDKDKQDSRPAYVSPSVIRLGDVNRGIGACVAPGSGNIGNCATGNSPTGNCKNPGSTAGDGNCSNYGVGAAGTCASPGAGPRSG